MTDSDSRPGDDRPSGGGRSPRPGGGLPELERWYYEWAARYEPTMPFRPEENTEYPDYNLYYPILEATPEQFAELMMRGREIMGRDPKTGLPVDPEE
jgi:hypothetical protein